LQCLPATKGQESSPGENSGVRPRKRCRGGRRGQEGALPLGDVPSADGGGGGQRRRWLGRGGGGGYGEGPHRGRFGSGGGTEGKPVSTQLQAGVPSASSSEAVPSVSSSEAAPYASEMRSIGEDKPARSTGA
jgi:hypothetical protein